MARSVPQRQRAREDPEPLIDALGDPDPGVRLHAAVALAEAGDAHARDAILAKLDAAEVDRGAVLAALGGMLARVPSDGALTRLRHELDLAAGPERDAIAGALGRARVPAALNALASLAVSPDVATTLEPLPRCCCSSRRTIRKRGTSPALFSHTTTPPFGPKPHGLSER